MAKRVNVMDGMTLQDLISDDGLVIEMGEEEELDEKYYPYNPTVNLTNDEMIKLLNMDCGENDEDGEVDAADAAEAMSPLSLSFEKIKSKCVDLLDDGKIMKLIKQEGSGDFVQPNSLAIVHYGAYIEHQDEPFDSTFRHGAPGRLRLGKGEILQGLEYGLLTMKKHEVASFIIHHDYAYRELGCPPLVPPCSEILFIVQVVDIIDGGSLETLENLSIEERKKFKNVKIRADVLMKTAMESFKRGKTRQAIREYSRATNILEFATLEDDEDEAALNKILSKAYGNLAVCFNKEDKPKQACKCCLNVRKPTAKTYFHHGRALLKLGEYQRALEELQRSLQLDPNNVTTIKEMQLANTLQRKFVESEKLLWQNCLKVRKGEEAESSYTAIAKEFCESFANNESLLRLKLPEGLTPTEDRCIRQQAASCNLTIVQQVRYGKETFYLTKPPH